MGKLKKKKESGNMSLMKLHKMFDSSSMTIKIWNHKLKILVLKMIFHKRNCQEILQ